MKNRFYGVLTIKHKDGTIEKTEVKTKKVQGKGKFLTKLQEIIVQYIDGYDDAPLADIGTYPLSYAGDFEESFNEAIKGITKHIIETKSLVPRNKFLAERERGFLS